MANEIFGIIDGNKTYTHHAIASQLGRQDSKGKCSRFVLLNLFKEGLCFRKAGSLYLISGHNFNLWVQEGSAPWEAWKDQDTNFSGDEDESDSFAAGGTPKRKSGGTKRSAGS